MPNKKEKKPSGLRNFLNSISVQTRYSVLRMTVAILIGLLLATVLIVTTAKDPGKALYYFFLAPTTSITYFSYWINEAEILAIMGVAVCIMFSANQFNLGLEGSFYLGGLVSCLSGLYLVPNLTFFSPFISILLAGLVGAIITLIPALLSHKWKASVMVSSLMMNYLCLYFGMFLLFQYFKDPATSKHTYQLTDTAQLTHFVSDTKINTGIFIAAIIVVAGWAFLYHTKLGHKLRTAGQNAIFAKYAGLNVAAIAIIAQVVGGFIGGVGGGVYMLSQFERFNWTELKGYGWDGVTIAIFAHNNPKYVPIAALFIGYLRAGATVMSYKAGVQTELTSVVEGIIILFLLAERFLAGTYRKMIFAEADRKRKDAMLQQMAQAKEVE